MAADRPQADRLLELLADRATQGLTAEEARELELLLATAPDVDPSAFDFAAAAVHLTAEASAEPLPAGLEAKLRDRAAEFGAASSASASAAKAESPEPSTWSSSLAWYAAAACLAAAVVGWWPGRIPTPTPDKPPPVEDPKPVALTLEDVAASRDALRIAWTGTEDPAAAGAQGEVLWSNELQSGFMRFSGLPANDATEYQYQLWIFDGEQDERYPIDGGVFDVAAGETLVPIDAKLQVVEPTLFAVTIEKPGGVVVSSRERIVLVAAAG